MEFIVEMVRCICMSCHQLCMICIHRITYIMEIWWCYVIGSHICCYSMIGHYENCVVVGIANSNMTAYLLWKDASTPGIGNLTFFTMPSCPICSQSYKKQLTLHLLSNSQCRSAWKMDWRSNWFQCSKSSIMATWYKTSLQKLLTSW